VLLIGLIGFFVAATIGYVVIRFGHVHAHFSADHDIDSPQKFHSTPVPRIGGLPIFVAFLTSLTLGCWLGKISWTESVLLLACTLPVFGAGLLEDVTKLVGPMPRLMASFLSASLGFYLLDGGVFRLDILGVDFLLGYWPVSLLVTMFAVGGVSHAINIVDGTNGLAGGISIMIFAALGYVSFQVGDTFLLAVCGAIAGAVLGFLVWNYPRGLIFAGDGGAYLLGFLIAEVSLLLVKHPEVSPWFPLLLVSYPVVDTIFAIYRKRVIRGKSPGLPDGLHIHMLVYKRLVSSGGLSWDKNNHLGRNSRTSPYLWFLTLIAIIPAVIFWKQSEILMIVFALYFLLCGYFYVRIVKFKTPKFFARNK